MNWRSDDIQNLKAPTAFFIITVLIGNAPNPFISVAGYRQIHGLSELRILSRQY